MAATPRVELVRGGAEGLFRFRIVNRDGTVLVTSQDYESQTRMRTAVRAVLHMPPWAAIEDLTTAEAVAVPRDTGPGGGAGPTMAPRLVAKDGPASSPAPEAPTAEDSALQTPPARKAAAKKSPRRAPARREAAKPAE
jgi:uncharacterized protein YegP (UPF0339 family)